MNPRALSPTQGADQGHDPRVAETQGRGPPPVRGQRGERDPLKGWAREDTALADPLSIEHSVVDVTGLGLQLGQVVQATVAVQVIG